MKMRCILEDDCPHIPRMEGKLLLAAYLGAASIEETPASPPGSKVIAVDFGRGKPAVQPPTGSEPDARLFEPLDQFVVGDHGPQWHDPAGGIVAVQVILEKLRNGAGVCQSPDMESDYGDEEEFHSGVVEDLKDLEQMLMAAQEAGTRFCIDFDS